MKHKLVVILGPTASGKSALAIRLARAFKGEVVSADSRQVYKGMNIGTGKVTKKEQRLVTHHLLDVASPKRQFTVSQFKNLADKAIQQIINRQKLPFLTGGTAFYIYSVTDDLELPQVQPDLNLRKQLDQKTAPELFKILKKLDPRRAKSIDPNNKRRLIRAIEINKATGQPVPKIRKAPAYETLYIGLKKEIPKLTKLINQRLTQRLKQGMINEVKKLRQSGLSYKKLEAFGLEYRYISKYLQGQISKEQMIEQLSTAIRQFAKRQMTWFKRDNRIHWISNPHEAKQLIKKFLDK